MIEWWMGWRRREGNGVEEEEKEEIDVRQRLRRRRRFGGEKSSNIRAVFCSEPYRRSPPLV